MEEQEKAFLETYDDSIFEKPSVATDAVAFRWRNERLQLLLIKRTEHPYQGIYALPGGFVQKYENLEDAVVRKLKSETGVSLSKNRVEQLMTLGDFNRDPRGWIISVSYLCFIPYDDSIDIENETSSEESVWVDANFLDNHVNLVYKGETIESLAFDHSTIISEAFKRVQGRFAYNPTIYTILPEANRIKTYQEVYVAFTGDKKMGQTQFARKNKKFFNPTSTKETTSTRPGTLYSLSL